MAKHRKNPDRPEPTYDVGYQKPPDEHKFKPGHKGFGPRRKKLIDVEGLVAEALLRPITLTVDGRSETMSYLEAGARRFAEQYVRDPAKILKQNGSAIAGAVRSQTKAAGIDENGVDMTAAFRAKIEKLAERYRLQQEMGQEQTTVELSSEPDKPKT